MAESTEGFSNYTEIIQHLQTSKKSLKFFLLTFFFVLQFGIIIITSMTILVDRQMMKPFHHRPPPLLHLIQNHHPIIIILNKDIILTIKIGRIIIILVDRVEIRIIHVLIMMAIGILEVHVFRHIVRSIV